MLLILLKFLLLDSPMLILFILSLSLFFYVR